jgi:hypothetical protein
MTPELAFFVNLLQFYNTASRNLTFIWHMPVTGSVAKASHIHKTR